MNAMPRWHEGRSETALERCDRNLVELIAPTAYHRILFRLGDKERP